MGHVRANNEDSFDSVPELGFYIVADGLGGAAAGERASKMAVETVVGEVRAAGETATAQKVAKAVELANRQIRWEAENDLSLQGMGTTVTAAIVRSSTVEVVNAGDSRAYRFRPGSLQCLTRDHTWVSELASENDVDPDQFRNHPYRHMLTKAVGSETRVEPDASEATFLPGDILLLCTDGLHGVLGDDEIASSLRAGDSIKEKAEALISATLDHGAPDNVTVLLVRHPGAEPTG